MTASSTSLPLATLLAHASESVQAVMAGQSLTEALGRVPAAARPGTQALSFHAMRWLGGARAARTLLAPRTPPAAVEALLVTALALLWPQSAPPYADHVVVHQAVALARRRMPASQSFINAVLRRFLREREAIVAQVSADPVAHWQHPRWWIERLQHDWPSHWEALLTAANLHPPMCLRVNRRRVSVPDYLSRLADAGIEARALGGQAVLLERARPVQQLPGFAEGLVSVQDAAAQLAAPLLLAEDTPAGGWRLPPGARVLDACAAPGGKTAHLLELADLDVLALDQDATRLARVEETLQRLGLRAEVKAADARDTAAWWDGRPFDAILLDAPCSASGIVRRHPDVRWLRRASDLDSLAAMQAAMLEALWPLLAPGGRLLYATCSIFRAEGQTRIDAFLQQHPDARRAHSPAAPGHLLPLADNRPESSAATSGDAAAALQDGFFYDLLDKP